MRDLQTLATKKEFKVQATVALIQAHKQSKLVGMKSCFFVCVSFMFLFETIQNNFQLIDEETIGELTKTFDELIKTATLRTYDFPS